MALTGLQIQKLLPGTNCRECGSNTCLAFAMKLAARKAEISLCPYATDEAKKTLGDAYEPPVRKMAFGPDRKLAVGEETVLYRHEKTFVNRTIIAVNIDDTDENAALKLGAIASYRFERVGQTFEVDMISVTQKSNSAEKFLKVIGEAEKITGRPLILRSTDAGALKKASEMLKGSGTLICAADPDMALALFDSVKENGHSLAITAPDLDSLVCLSSAIKERGFNDLVIQFKTGSLSEQFQVNSIARRSAIKDSFKPLGYPFIRFLEDDDIFETTMGAVTETVKYGSICVLPVFDPAILAPLFTLRLNIYTDPQSPIQVEPKIYQIGDPTPDSPVFVTTNFSLTYFTVSGEIENSGTSAWLVVPDCEGMSVLTAWAAGKFNAAVIAKFIKETGMENTLRRRDIVIPGYVAQISGELEECLPGWKVMVGPEEAADIESFVRMRLGG